MAARCYVDPTVQPDPAAYALYGWLLRRGFEAGGAVEATQPLPDPRDMDPAP